MLGTAEQRILEELVSRADESKRVHATQKEMAEKLGIHKSRFSILVKQLWLRGLIKKEMDVGGQYIVLMQKAHNDSQPVREPTQVKDVWEFFNEQLLKHFNTKLKILTEKRRRDIVLMLKDYPFEDIKKAIVGFCNDPFEERRKYLDLQYVRRHFEKYLTLNKKGQIATGEVSDHMKKKIEEDEKILQSLYN